MAIEVGAKVSGKVSGITNFGAFVDLGEHKTGLVHISEISDGYIKEIKDVLKVGDDVKVKVLSVGDDGKIALSIRQATDKPAPKEKPAAQPKMANNRSTHGKFGDNRHHNDNHKNNKANFDDLMDSFLKESESRLATIKKNTEGKRGGRGGRRS
ncbi:MAG: S1 domain-containing RNA-binding protein [Apilactobacillus sp.]|uniref:S1 domain-containing RNA-binding protein n=1 Tax=Apilactobacillus TaxID=2767877 RepID=UPI0025F27B65|nr:S1 domain-containing RNA-binding protein [Apilactobacillus sp.]MCT6822851.1 S1 domain-containing RNA-binding protein [Apilactobacillus sp.]MCT6858532.1 S1 domain-containing RNA-binding protein [Apilactobacillus sp.]